LNSNGKFPNYYANEDIIWIDRVDLISQNFAGFIFCPICGSCFYYKFNKAINILKISIYLVIDNKKQIMSNISSLFSKSRGKYFLIHNECFKKSITQNDIPKVKKYFTEHQCIFNFQPKFQPQDIANYKVNSNKKFYSLVWEFYHPVSSLLYFKLDKVLPVLDNAQNVID